MSDFGARVTTAECYQYFDMIEIMRASFYHKKYVKKDHYPAFEELNSH